MKEEFDFESIKNKAIEQLKAGKPLLLLILQIISVFQIMYEPMVLTKGGPDNASLSLMQLMWQYAFGGSMNYGKASAVAVIVTLILLVMTAIYSYFDRKESDWD